MHQQPKRQSSLYEANILLASQAIDRNQIESERRAADTYSVSRTTLRRRRNGITARRDYTPKAQNLTPLEEEVITKYILDLDSRGFPPRLEAVRAMANLLLSKRDAPPVGKNWPSNFVRRAPELKTCLNRAYDRQRAKCEDPVIITKWFDLVRNTKAKYGIVDEDIHNFDETGFMMGMISTGSVVTSSERRNRPKQLQQGDREWVTVIQGINATGWAIPPFVIFKAQNHLANWYTNETPRDWAIGVSDNGWTTNELGLEWIKHFDKHTKDRMKGAYRLLIIDGHESHQSVEFDEFCAQNKIITLCMPAHSSHLLQPLDVGCFSPLKKAYGKQIENLMRALHTHIAKGDFLPAFKVAFAATFTSANIQGGFRGAGLVPHDPEAVVSKLDVRLRTPTPLEAGSTSWESKTPQNMTEVTSQSTLIQSRIASHQNSSPTPIYEAINLLTKGVGMIAHQATLIQAENVELRHANTLATQRRKRKRKRIQKHGVLTVAEGLDLVPQNNAVGEISQEVRGGETESSGPAKKKRRCKTCGETGHNLRTCKKDVQTNEE